MCSKKQFETVYSYLVKNKEVNKSALPEILKEIPASDINDAVYRLQTLGFVELLRFFDGNELIEMTKKGNQMYRATY